MNLTPEPTPQQAGLDVDQGSSPLVSPVSPLTIPTKMSASPRPRMPAGPRIRKNTAGATTLTAHRSITPLNLADYPPLPGSDRNSPGPATSDSSHSVLLPPSDPPPLPPNEKAVQTEPNDPVLSTSTIPLSTPVPSQAPATPESTRPSTPASVTNHRTLNKPTTLPIPTPVNFNVDPISFKGLPLEAAQWSFTSDQLRDMVSRAIRDSAKEQFIRLLSLDALDKEIPEELARLESLRFTTQAQHRFHFQRRTNLLQSLNALAYSSSASTENGANTLGMLIQQLAEVTASMDRFTETLLKTSEHRSQLAQVQEKHLSSALAVALRKLNASYAKRTTDLKSARARIAALQTELEEAWKVAEGMAEEIDDLENFKSDYAMENSFENGETESNDIHDDDPTVISVAHAKVVPVTGTAIVSKATLVGTPPPNGDQKFLTPPNTHVRRPRLSNASTSDRDRLTRVSAARKRISLISQTAIKVQRSNSESDGGSGPSAPNTPKSRRKRKGSQGKGKDPVPASPSLLSGHSNSFLELSRPATPQPFEGEGIPPVPTLARVQHAGGGASMTPAIKLDMEQIHIAEDYQANLDYSPAFSAAFDSTMIPPPPPDSDLPSPLTRTSSMNLPHPPIIQDTRRIQSMQPSLSVSPSFCGRDLEDYERMAYGSLQDCPVVPARKVSQVGEEAHVVPLPDAEEDDEKPSTSHHAYDKSDLWPWTKRNTAILADASPESLSSSADDEVGLDAVVNIGPSASMNITLEIPEHEHASASSYLPDMTTPSSSSTNGDGTENTGSLVSIIASEDSEAQQGSHERQGEHGNGTGRGESAVQEPPSPVPSDVPEMPVFPQARNSTLSLERHGTIGSLVARKNSLFRSHSSNNSHEKRSSMPLPSAVIASLLPWRGSKRPSSEPELPSQSSRTKSRLSSSLPSPH